MTLGGGGQSLFKQSCSQGGHASSEDTKDPDFDLSRGIRTSESEHPLYLMNVSCMDDMKKGVQSFVSRSKLCPPPPFPLCTE